MFSVRPTVVANVTKCWILNVGMFHSCPLRATAPARIISSCRMWRGVFRIATLNMETTLFSETVVNFFQIIQRHVPEHGDLQNHHSKNINCLPVRWLPLSASLVSLSRPLNPLLAGNVLPATQCYAAGGDILNGTRSLNCSVSKPR